MGLNHFREADDLSLLADLGVGICNEGYSPEFDEIFGKYAVVSEEFFPVICK